MMSRSTYFSVIAAAILLGLLFIQPSQCQTYYCTGDVDGDSIPLQPADLQYLTSFVNFTGLPPTPIYRGDLNGDCVVDQADIEMFEYYFISGMSCFPTYPVPTCSDPDTVRGACCDSIGDCSIRSFANCRKAGGSSLLHGTACGPADVCAEPRCVHRPPDLVAWYPFDYVGWDIAGRHNGKRIGAYGGDLGKVGPAYSFRWNPAGAIRVQDDPFQYITGGSFTIDAWIRPEAWNYGNCDWWPSYCRVRPIIDNTSPPYG